MPPVQQVPAHTAPETHWQLQSGPSVCPEGQGATQLLVPVAWLVHRVVPAGQVQVQVVVLRLEPGMPAQLTQTRLALQKV